MVASDLIRAHPLTCSRPAGARTRHCVRTTVVHEAGRTGADVSAGGCDYAGSGLVILRSHHSTDQLLTHAALLHAPRLRLSTAAHTRQFLGRCNGCECRREEAHARAGARLRMATHARTHARARTHACAHTHTHTHTLARAKTVTPSFLLFRTLLLFPQDQEGPSIAEWNGIKRKFKKTDKTVTCECHL